MPSLSRRSLLAGSAALAARPAFGAITPSGGPLDVIIIGAGLTYTYGRYAKDQPRHGGLPQQAGVTSSSRGPITSADAA